MIEMKVMVIYGQSVAVQSGLHALLQLFEARERERDRTNGRVGLACGMTRLFSLLQLALRINDFTYYLSPNFSTLKRLKRFSQYAFRFFLKYI